MTCAAIHRSNGHDGGEVVFDGTPAELVVSGDSLTAQHLRAYVGGDRE